MPRDFAFRCGGASGSALPHTKPPPRELSFRGAGANVCLRVEDVSSALWARVPELARDLIDVATFVYAADQSCSRGGSCDEEFGDRWRRRLHLSVAVRRPEVWSSLDVRELLVQTLSFLSEDEYHFHFEPL